MAAPIDFVGRSGAGPREAADWSRRQELMTDLRSTRGRAYPRIVGLMREPSWVLFEILLPFLSTSAFVFVYRAIGAPQAYVGFVVLGGALTAFWLNVIWMMANQLWWEKSQGNLELYFAAPMHFMSILFGMALGGMSAYAEPMRPRVHRNQPGLGARADPAILVSEHAFQLVPVSYQPVRVTGRRKIDHIFAIARIQLGLVAGL